MMDKGTKIWIQVMAFFRKYWGCHQIRERSFSLCNYQFPICARCTGILLGYIVAIILLLMKIRIELYICVVMSFPLIVDGSLQYIFKVSSNNTRRFITGILFGVAIIYLIAHTMYFIKHML